MEKQCRVLLLFEMVNLSSVKFMAQRSNIGVQCETIALIGSMIFLSQPVLTSHACQNWKIVQILLHCILLKTVCVT